MDVQETPQHKDQMSFCVIFTGYNVAEVAHDCVVTLKNWFEGRGIKNSFDTWHGKFNTRRAG